MLLGGSDAVASAKRTICEMPAINYVNLTGKTTLNEAAAVISRCDFYIGADTGLMHMASAFGKPIIELSVSLPDSPATYGSSPTRTGAYCVPSIVLCPPRGIDGCTWVCRKKYAHCINLIDTADVCKAIEYFIKRISQKGDL